MRLGKLSHLWRIIRCRVFFGHVMIPYGNEGEGNCRRKYVWYMCARCLWCERLEYIGRDKEAE